MERLDIKRLREEDVTRARAELRTARTTKEKHYARLTLQRALREKGEEKDGEQDKAE